MSSRKFGARRRLPEKLEPRHDGDDGAPHHDHAHRKSGFKRGKTGGEVGLRGERAAGGVDGAAHDADRRLGPTVPEPGFPKSPGGGKRVEGRSVHGASREESDGDNQFARQSSAQDGAPRCGHAPSRRSRPVRRRAAAPQAPEPEPNATNGDAPYLARRPANPVAFHARRFIEPPRRSRERRLLSARSRARLRSERRSPGGADEREGSP